MEFFETLRKRRTIRRFSAERISGRVLRRLIDVVRYAPSSMDGQPWAVIAVRGNELKEKLALHKNKWCPAAKREFDAGFIKAAPVVLVVCVDRARSYARWVENGVIAGAYLTLAARALGLASVFMTAFNLKRPAQMREIRALLSIPTAFSPVCLIPVGYPADKPSPKQLRPLRDIAHYEKF